MKDKDIHDHGKRGKRARSKESKRSSSKDESTGGFRGVQSGALSREITVVNFGDSNSSAKTKNESSSISGCDADSVVNGHHEVIYLFFYFKKKWLVLIVLKR